MRSFAVVTFLAIFVLQVQSHGRLYEPPGRASAWRFGFKTPADYNDNELFCGGFGRQYNNVNQGRCGVCGDEWSMPTPRLHEDGGKYGTGLVVRKHLQGSEISVTVDITAHHKGWFEFKVCPIVEGKEVTQECLDQYPLYINEANGTRYHLPPGSTVGIYKFIVRLPEKLTCDRCFFQWHYTCGNNWGICPDGKGAVGCGIQETFRGCADITIA